MCLAASLWEGLQYTKDVSPFQHFQVQDVFLRSVRHMVMMMMVVVVLVVAVRWWYGVERE